MPLNNESFDEYLYKKAKAGADLIVPSKAREFEPKKASISMIRGLRIRISRRSVRKGK
jgi:hypothetical protein